MEIHTNRAKSYFSVFNLSEINGAKETQRFLDSLFRETINSFKRYFDNQPNDAKEYGFEFREQQVKTYLTIALNEVTKGNFMQEYPNSRIFHRKGSKKNIEQSTGFIDYWADMKESTYLMEIKHQWIKYHPETDEYTFYSYLQGKFKQSVAQIDSIENKMNLKTKKHLFGIALTIVPVFVKNNPLERIILDKETINFFIKECMGGKDEMRANVLGGWILEENYLQEFNYSEDSESEYYPAVLFLAKVKKYSRG